MRKNTGKQVQLNEIRPHGLNATLDNGVEVIISFSENEIHLHFSCINYDKGIRIKEADLIGEGIRLSNYVTVQYKPKEE